MNITNTTGDIIESIEKLNRMLFMFSGAGKGIGEKLMNVSITQSVEGLGQTVDKYC